MRRLKSERIALFGHFDSTNFGNECSLQAILQQLRRAYPDAKFLCITDNPERAVKADDLEAIPINKEFFRFWTAKTPLERIVRRAVVGLPIELRRCISGFIALRRAQMLIIPGTGLLSDAYGLEGAGPYGLFRWSVIARLCGCKLLFLGVGVGPLYSRLGRFFAKSALRLSNFRSYREVSSREYLISIGFKAENDPVYPDLAFSLPVPARPQPSPDGRQTVALGVMTYAGKYSALDPRTETEQAYLNTLVQFTRWLLANGYNVRLVIGDTVDNPIKDQLVRVLASDQPAPGGGRIIDEPISSVEGVLSAFAACDLAVATRFHNVLLALLCGKPVIAISFHHKIESLMASVGLSEYCVDIHAFDADALIRKFQRLSANAETIGNQVALKALTFRGEVEEEYKRAFS